MADTLVHRGPDQKGAWVGEGISLGHRRLSIIDLSEQARQPMPNEDHTVWLVYNGEIYNFQDLRERLQKRGHRFQSRSDSEVILHGYEEYGREIVCHLRGMFAFAVWDGRKRRLFLARDRLGIKPLYYWHRNGRFAFASEIKALLQIPEVPRLLNPQAFYDYVGFEFVPAPQTMLAGIWKVPAGHWAEVCEGSVRVESYWDLSFRPAPLRPSYAEAVERLRQELEAAVASHLVSDVPLGVFLSGGLDSSAVVAMMRRHITGPLRTFTVAYADPSFSELDYAKRVAERFATEHHVLMIEEVTASHLERAVWHLDEPMTDLSAIPLMLACSQARQHVTVTLSGEGGDECFAGYDRFRASRIDRIYRRLVPGPIRRGLIAPLVRRLPDRPQKKGSLNMLKRFVEGSLLPPEGGHLRWQYFSGPEQDRRLFAPSLLARVRPDPFRVLRVLAGQCDAEDPVNRELYLDTRYVMPESVLMKVDKMGMAHSLEIRVPFLDHALVEFMASLPGAWKLRRLQTKRLFRSALEGLLPREIVYRGKQGYSLPVKHLLRASLRAMLVEVLNESPLVRQCCQIHEVRRLIEEHLAMRHNHNHVLWALLNAALWQSTFDVRVD